MYACFKLVENESIISKWCQCVVARMLMLNIIYHKTLNVGLWDIPVTLGLKIIMIMKKRESPLLLFIIYFLLLVQSTSFTYIKSKASGIKIKLTLEHHETDGNFWDKLVLWGWLKSLFSCVNLHKKPNFSGSPLPSHLLVIKFPLNNITVNITNIISINGYIIVTGSSKYLIPSQHLYYFRLKGIELCFSNWNMGWLRKYIMMCWGQLKPKVRW